jgi:hypothetical protein
MVRTIVIVFGKIEEGKGRWKGRVREDKEKKIVHNFMVFVVANVVDPWLCVGFDFLYSTQCVVDSSQSVYIHASNSSRSIPHGSNKIHLPTPETTTTSCSTTLIAHMMIFAPRFSVLPCINAGALSCAVCT